jgi:hypothetical protein
VSQERRWNFAPREAGERMTKLGKRLEDRVGGALSSTEENVRTSLAQVREGAETRLRSLIRLLDRHPAGSLAAAFVTGWLLARLLQKLD